MAGVTSQFADALNRKYDIQQDEARARSGLYGAQATNLLGSLPFENQVRASQAAETNARASTIQPLAQSQINVGQAGIGQTQAQTGLIGAQTRGVNISNNPVSDSVLRALFQSTRGNGFGSIGTSSNPGVVSQQNESSVVTPSTQTPNTSTNSLGLPSTPSSGFQEFPPGFAMGTDEVPYAGTGGPTSALGSLAYAMGTMSVETPKGRGMKMGVNSDALPISAKGGTTKVPGKGVSTVDTVPAMLAPREAVLNEHAADLIGRDKIAAANAIGNALTSLKTPPAVEAKANGTQPMTGDKGSATPVKAEEMSRGTGKGFSKGTAKVPVYYPKGKAPMKPQALAKGTHMVTPGKSAKSPKVDPKGLAAVMQMMQSMGGQSAPMPTPMGQPMAQGRGMM